MARDWLHLRIELNGSEGHFGDNFQRKRILDGFLPAWSPNKWTVPIDKHGAHVERIKMFKTLDNDVSSFPFVGGLDFLCSHGSGHRHFTVEVIGVRGAETWNSSAGLRECDRIARASVHDRPNAGERFE